MRNSFRFTQGNTYPFVYARAGGGETLLVILNPAASAASAEFSFPVEYRELKLLAGKEVHTTKSARRSNRSPRPDLRHLSGVK